MRERTHLAVMERNKIVGQKPARDTERPDSKLILRPYPQNAAKMIKESMDKKFGSSWHVVIGEGFGFEVTHEVKNLLYMFFGGSLAVCVWKCA
ncbi:unnamed protein product [Coregonus sp. 'balchen']|nr:unnamed protein product [Coregonus sp. 'balchen']